MNPPSVLLRSPVFMNLRRGDSARRTPSRRVPYRCMSDLFWIACRPKVNRPRVARTTETARVRARSDCRFEGGFSRHGSGVRWADKTALAEESTRAWRRHRRTVGLDIPRQVAPLQSLTPLLQARGPEPNRLEPSKTALAEPHLDRDRTIASANACSKAGQDTPVARGKDTPEESKKKIWASP
jgi:hypothetical protein